MKPKLEIHDDHVVITLPRNETPVRPMGKPDKDGKVKPLALAIIAKTDPAWQDSDITAKLEDGHEVTVKFSASVGFNPDKPKAGQKFKADLG